MTPRSAARGATLTLLTLLGACTTGRGTADRAVLPAADAVFGCARTLGTNLSFADAPRDHALGATIAPLRINLRRWSPEGPWQRAITVDWITVTVYFVGDWARANTEAATQRRPRDTWDPAPPEVRALADSIEQRCRQSRAGTE
jgi:hypothetical protein